MFTLHLDLPKDHHFLSIHQLFGREAKNGKWFVMLKHAPHDTYVGAMATYGRGVANTPDEAFAKALTSITDQLSRPAYITYQRGQEELKQLDTGDFLI